MKISELSVKHYQFTVLMFAMLVALGVSSWLSIPRGEDPVYVRAGVGRQGAPALQQIGRAHV